jgi:hypothetical protein
MTALKVFYADTVVFLLLQCAADGALAHRTFCCSWPRRLAISSAHKATEPAAGVSRVRVIASCC